MQININVYDLTKVETITFRPSFVEFAPRRVQYGLLRPSCCSHYRVPARSRSVLIGNFFSIKARARPHGSYIENFPPWRRRNEILCSSGKNNISRLKAANEWYIVLSRNSLKIFRSYRVFFQVFSLSCFLEHAIYIFVAYLSLPQQILQQPLFQATNKPSSFSKVWKVRIVMSLLNTTTRVTYEK